MKVLRKYEKVKGCNHVIKKQRHYHPHYYDLYSDPHPEPSKKEINEFRLWKAPCEHWVSLVGSIKEVSNV